MCLYLGPNFVEPLRNVLHWVDFFNRTDDLLATFEYDTHGDFEMLNIFFLTFAATRNDAFWWFIAINVNIFLCDYRPFVLKANIYSKNVSQPRLFDVWLDVGLGQSWKLFAPISCDDSFGIFLWVYGDWTDEIGML